MSARARGAEGTGGLAGDAEARAGRPARASGAQLLVRALEELGVRVAFGLPGAHNLNAWDAFAASGVRLVGVRHEQAAVYAADGLARATGELGVAITTSGPAAANTLAATGEAYASHSPVVVLATTISRELRRPGVYRGALHETRDQAAMFAPVVKQVLHAEDPGRMAALFAEAAGTALSAPRGPVYVEIPTDVLAEESAEGAPGASAAARPAVLRPGPEPEDVARAARIMESSERPLIWAGGGALQAGAGPAVAALAERLSAPVIETYMARGLLPPGHPSWCGLPPHVPEIGGLWDRADLTIAVGTDFDAMMTQNWAMPQPERLISVNIDPVEGTKNYAPDLLLVGDAAAVAAALADAAPRRGDPGATAADLRRLREAASSRIAAQEPAAFELLGTLRAALTAEAFVFADMCIPGYWVAGFHPFAAPRRLAYPVGWGTLGFAFPASLGAALGREGPVLCVCGDGGFVLGCGELATAAQEEIPVTVLVIDDGGYGMLRFDQDRAGHGRFGVDLHTPDFVQLARAFDVRAERVAGVGPELRRALASHLPERAPSVIVTEAAISPPPTTSPRWYRRATQEED